MELNCDFYYSMVLMDTRKGDVYQCSVTKVKIVGKRPVVKAIYGVHAEGKTNKDVKCVKFSYRSRVYRFPRDLHKHFPNLTSLVFPENCGIKKICKKDLKGLERLENFSVFGGRVSSLPDDLLTDMPNLRVFIFKRNKIKFASSKLLEPLLGRPDVVVMLDQNKINACCRPGFAPGAYFSLEEVMKIIDKKCLKPVVSIKDQHMHPFFITKMKELWTSGQFSDLTLIVEDKKFKVHKAILLTQSKVFEQIFEDQSEAKEIEIADFSSDSIEALLNFIYTYELFDDDNAMRNFEIADKFKVEAMRSEYEEIICDQLDDSNALKTFRFAHRLSSQLLKEEAFYLINRKFPGKLPKYLMEDPEKLKKFLHENVK